MQESKTRKYDFMIVGAGFAGATCARLLKDKGYSVIILEERPFVGGNCATDIQFDIQLHIFDAHVLHTNNLDVWNFLGKYDNLIPFNYTEYIIDNDKRYTFSDDINMCMEVYGDHRPYEIESDLINDGFLEDDNFSTLKEYLIYKYGSTIYEKIYKKYYERNFNEDPENLIPPVHQRTDNFLMLNDIRFYKEIYQGIPENGYTYLIEQMIGEDIPVMLNKNFLEKPKTYSAIAHNVIYTGEIDRLYKYCIGKLNWTTTTFSILDECQITNNNMGVPVTNFIDNTKHHRLIEHKWLTPWKHGKSEEFDKHTIVSYKYYKPWDIGEETMDLIRDKRSIGLYNRYLELMKKDYPNMLLCGKRAEYRNYSIAETIESAFKLCEQFKNKNEK
jgi:UDP-galactopyranose mutase